LISLVLFFGYSALEVYQFVKIPAYVAGSALAAWGLWQLPAAGNLSRRWRTYIRCALVLVCLQIYFAPFLAWWRMAPEMLYYFVNVLGLLLAGMLALIFVNLLAADVFHCLRHRSGEVEALVFALGVVLLMIAPLGLTVLLSLLAVWRQDVCFAGDMWQTVIRLPVWVYMLMTLPCSLTLIAVWKAKIVCYRRLAAELAAERAKA
jgi:uncharacterized PurR-regulated membrane protein YhhQ (DUF165 family)